MDNSPADSNIVLKISKIKEEHADLTAL